MLILSRRIGERIVIDDTTVVTVVAMKDGAVKLGIEAPEEISVHRQEVHDRVMAGRNETHDIGGEG